MKRILLAIIFICSALLAFGQADSAVVRIQNYLKNIYAFNQAYPQEKVYLHLDNRSYFIGDTLWFKAYVVNATTLRLTDVSKVLYVELLNDKGVEMETRSFAWRMGSAMGISF